MTLMSPDESQPVIAAVSGAHMDRPVITTAGLLAREYRASLILLYVIEVSRKDPVEASSDATLGFSYKTLLLYIMYFMLLHVTCGTL